MKYSIFGKVIRGSGYGRKIGFPTLNIDRRDFSKLSRKPKFGVYSGEVRIQGKIYRAGIVIGPKDSRGLPKLEAHLLGFKRDVYGERAEFEIKKFIRKFKKYKSEEELINAISKDMKKC